MTAQTLFARLRAGARQFRKDQRGNVVIIFTLTLIPVIGAAVDYSRASSAKVAMQSAVDSTALMLSKGPACLTNSHAMRDNFVLQFGIHRAIVELSSGPPAGFLSLTLFLHRGLHSFQHAIYDWLPNGDFIKVPPHLGSSPGGSQCWSRKHPRHRTPRLAASFQSPVLRHRLHGAQSVRGRRASRSHPVSASRVL